MLLYPQWLLAARCPSCLGQFVYRTISVFEINSREEKTITCSEGVKVFSCVASGKSHLKIEIFGPCCEEPHAFLYPLSELSTPLAIELVCHDTGINLGYLGSVQAVTECICSDFQEMVDYCGESLSVFWQRPELVQKIFRRINKLYAEHNVSCLHCGSCNIDLETAHGDNVVLCCKDCGNFGVLAASRNVNLQILHFAECLLIDKGMIKIGLKKHREN